MKRLLLALTLSVAVLLPSIATAAGGTAAQMPRKTPLRYTVQSYVFSTTANITGAGVGVCPPGGAILKDVIVAQNVAGVGGTSWVAQPRKNGTALASTPGGWTLAAATNKSTNVATSGLVTLGLAAGGTRPVLDATAVKCAGGEVISVDVTLTGTYGTAVQGVVQLFWEPNY